MFFSGKGPRSSKITPRAAGLWERIKDNAMSAFHYSSWDPTLVSFESGEGQQGRSHGGLQSWSSTAGTTWTFCIKERTRGMHEVKVFEPFSGIEKPKITSVKPVRSESAATISRPGRVPPPRRRVPGHFQRSASAFAVPRPGRIPPPRRSAPGHFQRSASAFTVPRPSRTTPTGFAPPLSTRKVSDHEGRGVFRKAMGHAIAPPPFAKVAPPPFMHK